jgi:hypothetical protein
MFTAQEKFGLTNTLLQLLEMQRLFVILYQQWLQHQEKTNTVKKTKIAQHP